VACSRWARELHLDPIGTAGSYRGFLLVEWPLPWPRDLAEIPSLAPVAEAARNAGMRLQGLVPDSAGAASRVVVYSWPESGGARFDRAELIAEPAEVAAAALAILDEAPGPAESVDVLVCTHGRRDRCCGSLGTALAQELSGDPCPLGDGVRVWRTSHTGGHRFAPTAVVLPQGSAWAFCDTSALARIVGQLGSLDDLLGRYRGCAGLASPAIQALERAVLAELGWPLFEMARRGSDLGGGRTELVVDDPHGERAVFEAVVRVAEAIPVPECGMPIELATKSEPQLIVEGFRRR
jgi:hypothetical protein